MTAQILAPTAENIAFLGERLRAGELVAMPTETVYGLAASIWNEQALAQVFAAKERPHFDPLICHVSAAAEGKKSSSWLSRLVELGLLDDVVTQEPRYQDAEKLAQRFWPGPLTLVLPKAARVSDLATSGLESLAIRVPQHPTAQLLLEAAGVPLCAPSANRFGRISPTSAQDVFEELGERISWILEGGPCEIGLESTVVAFESEPRVLRRGGIAQEELQSALGKPVAYTRRKEVGSGQLASPGMLASHYAPRKKLFLLPEPLTTMNLANAAKFLAALPVNAQVGLLLWIGDEPSQRRISESLSKELHQGARITVAASLSPEGDEAQAARNLFRELRQLDADERVTNLVAEPPPSSQGLSGAILDRLQRAAS